MASSSAKTIDLGAAIQHLSEQGYAVVEGVLNQDHLERLRQEVDQLFTSERDTPFDPEDGSPHPDDVAKLDRSMIYSVHFCDGMLHQEGTDWDELALRGYMPGEGELSVQEWVEAVLATGFDGVWSCELASPRHWEWDLWKVARECRRCMELFLPGFPR